MTRSRPLASPEPADDAAGAEPQAASAGRSLGHMTELLGFRFRRIQNHLAQGLSQMHRFQGTKPGELSALAIMHANPGLSQVELSNEVGLDKAQIVVLIDMLERNGWARRERAPEDRRRNLLFVTEAGEAMLQQWMEIARENERPLREVLTPAEFELLSDLLDRIYNRCFNKVGD
jgi:DNA-binding MarR family transcriptional regulator